MAVKMVFWYVGYNRNMGTQAWKIKEYVPDFKMTYELDPLRQKTADSWPDSLDDTCAREEWDWKPEYDLDAMTKDMLENLKKKLL